MTSPTEPDSKTAVGNDPGAQSLGPQRVRVYGRWLLVGLVLLPVVFLLDAQIDGRLGQAWAAPLGEVIDALKLAAPFAMLAVVFANVRNGARLAVGLFAPLLVHVPILHLMKWVIGRARPLRDAGPFTFVPPWLRGGVDEASKYLNSFPSGHSAAPAIIALVLGLYFPRFRWMFYLWAAVLGVERIVTRWHYASDVLGAWLLAGVLVALSLRILGPAYYTVTPPVVARGEPLDRPSDR